jgi:predicted ATP-dependent protease
LSSLSNLPIKQNLAVTGSVNQQGKIQAIGGANQKIEGFYDVCQAIGLTGDQGVMVPHQNVKNMMLGEDIVKAAQEGRFHIYAVRSIDEGIEILTGVPAGEIKKDGTYTEGAVNYLVLQQLRRQAESMRSYSVPAPS